MSDPPDQTDPPEQRARARMLRGADESQPRGKNPFVPDDYPLVPIGVGPGVVLFFLDSHGQLQMQSARDLSRNNLQKHFSARPGYLIQHYPRPRKGQNSDEAETFKPELAADQLINACGWEGPWDPKHRLRGRGAWTGADGDLVLHLGDRLWVGNRLVPVGRRGDMVYPRGPALPRPSKDAAQGPGAADQLLALLDHWNWRRPELCTLLLLGWIGAALIGGALRVRPAAWLTGMKNSGKSLLQSVLFALFGNGTALIQSSDTTAAGVWQTLGYDSLPVALDEVEATVDNRRVEQLVTMMRQSYTGGDVQRGSSDGIAHQYPVKAAFLFSSINVIPLRAQDRSRCVILELDPLDPTHRFAVPFSELPPIGRALLRRMADHFERLQEDVLPAYRDTLISHGWDGRGADTIGTLLACASVLREDRHAIEADMELIGTDLMSVLELQRAEEAPDWQMVIYHLCDSLIDPWRGGERRPIGELLRVAAGYGAPPVVASPSLSIGRPELRSEGEAASFAATDEAAREAAKALSAFGVRLLTLQGEHGLYGEVRSMVAVANVSQTLNEIFRDTHWRGGSGTLGGWRQALARAPGACASSGTIRFRGSPVRATLVPTELFLRLREGTAAEDGL